MKNSELIQLNRLLKKYKEHMCSKYKLKDVSCNHQCEECPHSGYNDSTCIYFCGVDEYIEQTKEELIV